MFDVITRICGIVLLCALFLYWFLSSMYSKKEKQKVRPNSFLTSIRKTSNWLSIGLVCIQLAGASVLPISHVYAQDSQIVGLVVMFLGFGICIWARYLLGENWVGGYEYQIKKEQTLISNGIYAYIRHPIYTGLFLLFVGGELVAQSMLWISVLFVIVPLFMQAKREEALLRSHFKRSYDAYMKHTKMFIPFIW
jgi:protein-S-isoprenylcysteine O-methyltransferase Ste14